MTSNYVYDKSREFSSFQQKYEKITGFSITPEIENRYYIIEEHITNSNNWYDHPNGVVVKGNHYKFWKIQDKDCKLGLFQILITEDENNVYAQHSTAIVLDREFGENIAKLLADDTFLAFNFELQSPTLKTVTKQLKKI